MLTRRRALTITAAATAAALAMPQRGSAERLHQWRGIALGADASMTLPAGPQAESIVALALAEIARLERIFSLHRAESALVRLNTEGVLESPPFELLECLSLAGAVNHATGGAFDPTIQPLWALHATHHAAGRPPDSVALAEVQSRIGWSGVSYDAAQVRLAPGMALSLNGVAQGYIADRVADLLRAEGYRNVLVNTGEMHAIGAQPSGRAWPVSLDVGDVLLQNAVALRDGALASSAPLGITFDEAGEVSHILDPRTGWPTHSSWRMISVAAPTAGLADALSTAFCLMTEPEIQAVLMQFTDVHLVYAA